jgi:hypothetical protein
MGTTDESAHAVELVEVLAGLRKDLADSLVWRDDHDGRAYRGSANPQAGSTAQDITTDVDALENAGWIERRLPGSAVYQVSNAGHEALTRSNR